MWCIAVLKGFSLVTSHDSFEMKEAMITKSERDTDEVGRYENDKM